jgi:hypothetical protein
MKFMVTDPVIMAKAAKAQRKKQAAASKKTAYTVHGQGQAWLA